MTTRHGYSLRAELAVVVALGFALPALAADGTWNQDADGNWQSGDTTPWLGGVIADGSGFTANFTYDLTADRTVTLVGARTIGIMIFSDTGTDPDNNWLLNGASTLTLAGTPRIDAQAGTTAQIDVLLAGSAGVQLRGPGNLIIGNSANTYTGTTLLGGNNARVTISKLSNGGVASSIGAGAAAAANWNFIGGSILTYIGSGDSTNRLFTISSGSSSTLESSGSGAIAFTGTGSIVPTNVAGARSFTFSGTNTGNNTFTPIIPEVSNPDNGPVSIIKDGVGTWLLRGLNTYTGSTTIKGGTLDVNQLANGGSSSRIGASTSAAANLVIDGGTLRYSGSGHSTDRNYTLTTNGGGFDASGSGAVTFSGNMTASGSSGTQTFTLSGTNTGANTISGGINNGTGTNITALTKSGAGKWTLSGNNTYNGTTAVTAGTLALSTASNNNISGSTLVKISGGAFLDVTGVTGTGGFIAASGQTIAGTGTVLGDMTIGAGSTISPGNSPGIINETGTLTWLTGGNYNWQIYDATGAAGTGFDQIAVTGSLVLTGATGFNLNLWSLSSITPDTNGNALNFLSTNSYSWIIVTTTGGITGLPTSVNINTAAFNGTGGFTNPFTGTFSLDVIGDDLVLHYTAGPIPEPATGALLLSGLLGLTRRGRSNHG